MKIKEYQMQNILSEYFDTRRNFCLPNTSWGLRFRYEIDLLVVSPHGYCTEIEIKVDRNDLKRDCLKRHGHESKMIKNLYFAVPEYLADLEGWIPDRAGFIVVKNLNEKPHVYIVREAEVQLNVERLTEKDFVKLGWLTSMRFWNLRKRLGETK